MAELTLLIGERACSAASFQIWLAMRQAGLMFRVRSNAVDGSAIGGASLASEPPILFVDDVPIWEPLAIGEFLAEHVPNLWPSDPRTRALARSVAYEVQSGLRFIQTLLPFDVIRRFPTPRLVRPVRHELDRVVTVWRECRARFRDDGPFLFGHFSLADALHAAMAMRMIGNAIRPGDEVGEYLETISRLPAVLEWLADAQEEQRTRVRHGKETGAPDASSSLRAGPGAGDAASVGPNLGERWIEASSSDRAVKPIGAGTRRRH